MPSKRAQAGEATFEKGRLRSFSGVVVPFQEDTPAAIIRFMIQVRVALCAPLCYCVRLFLAGRFSGSTDAGIGIGISDWIRDTIPAAMEHVELWMVRHGETTRSVNREIAGWSNPPLTTKGRAEAAAVAERLVGTAFDGVWSSDLDRARESARLAGFEADADARLREFDFGDFEGRPFEALGDLLHQVRYHFKNFAIVGGETRDGFQQRVESFLGELPAGRHLLFVHGGVIRAVTQNLGVDRFVVTGSVVGVDWSGRTMLFVDEPEDSQPVFAPPPTEE